MSNKKNANLSEKNQKKLGSYASGAGGVVERAGGGAAGTSIFDPVLCELAYQWFCPSGGSVLDPFAGGSVRGVVAGVLGYSYTGIDLRAEQVEANRAQWGPVVSNIFGKARPVKISAKWASHKFCCEPGYIKKTCHGRCCDAGGGKTLISLLPGEAERFVGDGVSVNRGTLSADEKTKKCPFKEKVGFCKLHGMDTKPFGCIASPFTLNSADTLIVRHRYSMLKCHGRGKPAYITFRASLDLIFGNKLAGEICGRLAGGEGDFMVDMPFKSYEALKYLDGIKKDIIGHAGVTPVEPRWVVGDSLELLSDRNNFPDKFDMIFSCPPYGDLEVYSDDERDISTMPYEDFLGVYGEIIRAACGFLKKNRFAVFVVGDIRDPEGAYRGFPLGTIDIFRGAGLSLYNDAVLLTAIGSLPIRVGKQFSGPRKLGKTHQNILVFYKGDTKKIADELGVLDLTGLHFETEESEDSDE